MTKKSNYFYKFGALYYVTGQLFYGKKLHILFAPIISKTESVYLIPKINYSPFIFSKFSLKATEKMTKYQEFGTILNLFL